MLRIRITNRNRRRVRGRGRCSIKQQWSVCYRIHTKHTPSTHPFCSCLSYSSCLCSCFSSYSCSSCWCAFDSCGCWSDSSVRLPVSLLHWNSHQVLSSPLFCFISLHWYTFILCVDELIIHFFRCLSFVCLLLSSSKLLLFVIYRTIILFFTFC